MTEQSTRMEKSWISGIAYYAYINTPKKGYKPKGGKETEPRYMVTVGLEGEELDRAKAQNLAIKEPNQWVPMPHVEISRKIKTRKDGTLTPQPEYLGPDNEALDRSIVAGNGSKIKVMYAKYERPDGLTGTYLESVKVTELVEYARKDNNDTSGFFADDSATGKAGAGSAIGGYTPASASTNRGLAVKAKVNQPTPDDEIPF